MTFEEEMNRFFKEYSDSARKRVESNFFYQRAVERGDVIVAQKIAVDVILEVLPQNRRYAKLIRPSLDIDRSPPKLNWLPRS